MIYDPNDFENNNGNIDSNITVPILATNAYALPIPGEDEITHTPQTVNELFDNYMVDPFIVESVFGKTDPCSMINDQIFLIF